MKYNKWRIKQNIFKILMQSQEQNITSKLYNSITGT